MHAIIETGGKQYRVTAGDLVRVEKLPGEVGSEIELPVKASFKEGGELAPGGKVKATIVANGRGDRVLALRQEYQAAMREESSAMVAELTGCEVIAMMSANHIDPDLGAEIYILDRAPDPWASPDARGTAPSLRRPASIGGRSRDRGEFGEREDAFA